MLFPALREVGFRCEAPAGAYYILADFSAISDLDDDAFARWLAAGADGRLGRGVAPVPGSSFFHEPGMGRRLVRFAFCKRVETLRQAGEVLRALAR